MKCKSTTLIFVFVIYLFCIRVEKHLEVLFKMTHASTFNAAIQALSLIFTISLSKVSISDRFYRTLYESLLDPRISHSSKQSMYLNLLFKAVRADNDTRRVRAFVKRMVQIASRSQPSFVTGIFFLLSQVTKSKQQQYTYSYLL